MIERMFGFDSPVARVWRRMRWIFWSIIRFPQQIIREPIETMKAAFRWLVSCLQFLFFHTVFALFFFACAVIGGWNRLLAVVLGVGLGFLVFAVLNGIKRYRYAEHGRIQFLVAIAALLLLLYPFALNSLTTQGYPDSVSGAAMTVTDDGVIWLEDVLFPIRLKNVHLGPEFNSDGKSADMKDLLGVGSDGGAQRIDCSHKSDDVFGYYLARCELQNGDDLGEALIELGIGVPPCQATKSLSLMEASHCEGDVLLAVIGYSFKGVWTRTLNVVGTVTEFVLEREVS